jgi:hypothetical protein
MCGIVRQIRQLRRESAEMAAEAIKSMPFDMQ